MPGLLNFATQSVAHGLAPWHQLGVWEKQICGLHPALLKQNLHVAWLTYHSLRSALLEYFPFDLLLKFYTEIIQSP